MRILRPGNVLESFTVRRRVVPPFLFAAGEGEHNCQPYLIKVPAWVASPLGTYYLYCSNHNKGDVANPVAQQRIKLLYTNAASIRESLKAPWTVHPTGTLTLATVEAFGPYAHDAANAHIGSPSILIDDDAEQLRLWCHVQTSGALGHASVYATSSDGVAWTVVNANIGGTDGIYLSVFKYGSTYYAVEESGALRRSGNATGITSYVRQADIETFRAALLVGFSGGETIRHVGIEAIGDVLHVYATVRGDDPERVYYATCDLTVDWEDWACANRVELARPSYDFEGAFLSQVASAPGPATTPKHELRDPIPFTDPADGSRWLVYAAAGEHGIGILPL